MTYGCISVYPLIHLSVGLILLLHSIELIVYSHLQVCPDCDMCCASTEECQEPVSQRFGALEGTCILIGCVAAALCVAWVIVRFLTYKHILPEPDFSAIDAAGEDSVYFFLLSNRKSGWLITVGTLVLQVAIFGLFLSAAAFDNGDGDYVYSFRCPLNTPECNDERAVGTYGWVMWVFLVLASLLDDLVNGLKLLLISSARGSRNCFVTGLFLFCVTVLAVYSSFFYNKAIAMTDTGECTTCLLMRFEYVFVKNQIWRALANISP